MEETKKEKMSGLMNENMAMDWDMAIALIESKYIVDCYARYPRVRFRNNLGKDVFDMSPDYLNKSWKDLQGSLEAGLRSSECTICYEIKTKERGDRRCEMTVCVTCKNVLCSDCTISIVNSKNCKKSLLCPHCRSDLRK